MAKSNVRHNRLRSLPRLIVTASAPPLRSDAAMWKDADPDIPILQQAKAEYAKLHL
jgi:hypothetical protein